MKVNLVLIIILSIFNVFSDNGKKSIKDELKFGLLANELNSENTRFKNSEKLYQQLKLVQRHLEKKPVSNSEYAEACKSMGYIEGVFEGFINGIFAENYRHIHIIIKQAKTPPILCEKEKVNVNELIYIAVEGFEKMTKEQRLVGSPANDLAHIFLNSDVYIDCSSK